MMPPNSQAQLDRIIRYTCHLQRQNTNTLGFLPTVAIREYAQRFTRLQASLATESTIQTGLTASTNPPHG